MQTASRLFRERGFKDVGVAEIMQASGLTHGAFYGHFRSKAELAKAACQDACAQSLERWEKSDDITAILDRYLSPAHRDAPARGCAISALGAEVARQSVELQQDYAQGLERFIAALEGHIKAEDADARRRKATTLFAAMVGAVTMARGVASGDPALSDAILEDVRQQLRACFEV
nr:TetR/AcrR family transcriptional regulator [Ancylobacter radicis]